MKIIIAAGSAFVLVIVALIVVGTVMHGPADDAAVSCQVAIRHQLDNPGAAEFALHPKVIDNGSTFTVIGNVTGTNALGGTASQGFRCVVAHDGQQVISADLG